MTLLETKTAQWYQVEAIHEWENVQKASGSAGNPGGNQSAGAESEKKRLHDHPSPRNQMGTGKGNRRGN